MILQFTNYELDIGLQELRRGDRICSIEPQVFDVLHYLVEHHGRLVTREDLFEKIWAGRTVSDWALSSRISAARKAIGDSGKTQACVRTVPKRGFRFVAPVTVAADEGLPESLSSSCASLRSSPFSRVPTFLPAPRLWVARTAARRRFGSGSLDSPQFSPGSGSRVRP